MSTIGKQESLSASAVGAWELIGLDMIRTKRAPDGSGGMIVAQFWTSPSEEHARLMVAAPELLELLKAYAEGTWMPMHVRDRVRAVIESVEGRS